MTLECAESYVAELSRASNWPDLSEVVIRIMSGGPIKPHEFLMLASSKAVGLQSLKPDLNHRPVRSHQNLAWIRPPGVDQCNGFEGERAVRLLAINFLMRVTVRGWTAGRAGRRIPSGSVGEWSHWNHPDE
jgi:hypothetical protein